MKRKACRCDKLRKFTNSQAKQSMTRSCLTGLASQINPKPLVNSRKMETRTVQKRCVQQDRLVVHSIDSKEGHANNMKIKGGSMNDISIDTCDHQVVANDDIYMPLSLRKKHSTCDLASHQAGRNYKLPIWCRKTAIGKSFLCNYSLHDEIQDYAEYTKGVVKQMAVNIEETIGNVRKCVRDLWKEATVEPFGSYSTGLWLPSSDIDLVILGETSNMDQKRTLKCLQRLFSVLEKEDWIHCVNLVETAKVPVIKLVSAENFVPIDITFESTSTHSGLLARDLITKFISDMPQLYPLAIVLKQFLRERELNNAYTGGLSSYSTVLMIIHFIQLHSGGVDAFEAASIYASGGVPPVTPPPSEVSTEDTISSPSISSKEELLLMPSPVKPYLRVLMDPPTSSPKENKGSNVMTYAAIAASKKKPDSYAKTLMSSCTKVSKPIVAEPVPKLIPNTKSNEFQGKDLVERSEVLVCKSAGGSNGSGGSNGAGNNGGIQPNEGSSSSSISSSSTSSSSSSSSSSDMCLGSSLKKLLEFFGIVFDYKVSGISVRNGGFIYRIADSRKPVLVIEDPIHPTHNVGASTFAIHKIVSSFEDAYYALKYYRPSKFTPTPLACLLGASGHNLTYSSKHFGYMTPRVLPFSDSNSEITDQDC